MFTKVKQKYRRDSNIDFKQFQALSHDQKLR